MARSCSCFGVTSQGGFEVLNYLNYFFGHILLSELTVLGSSSDLGVEVMSHMIEIEFSIDHSGFFDCGS